LVYPKSANTTNLIFPHQRFKGSNGNSDFFDQFRFKVDTSFFESRLPPTMKPSFGFQNAPMRHLASIGSFIVTRLIGISATLGWILNGYACQIVTKIERATPVLPGATLQVVTVWWLKHFALIVKGGKMGVGS